MKISVEYFGQIREAAGVVREIVEVDLPVTARRLVESLAKERGGRFASLLLGPGGELSPSVLLAVEDRQVGPGDEATLRDGDEIVVIPPVSGG